MEGKIESEAVKAALDELSRRAASNHRMARTIQVIEQRLRDMGESQLAGGLARLICELQDDEMAGRAQITARRSHAAGDP